MKKCLLLFAFVFSLPIFAQNVEPSDSVMSQLWESMSEEEKGAIFKEFLNNEFQTGYSANEVMKEAIRDAERANADKYLDAKKRLRRGIILTSIGLGVASMPFISDDYSFSDSSLLWTAGGGLAAVGIPFIIIGANQTSRYKEYKPLAERFAREESAAKEKEKNRSKTAEELAMQAIINYNEKEYHLGKKMFNAGIATAAPGLAFAAISFTMLGTSGNRDGYVDFGEGVCIFFGSIGSAAVLTGAPLISIGAVKKQKYKPSLAISPNSAKFTMEF